MNVKGYTLSNLWRQCSPGSSITYRVTLNIRLFERSNQIVYYGRYLARIAQTKNFNKIVFCEIYRRSILGDVATMGRDNVKINFR
jgi:hypothetical protein